MEKDPETLKILEKQSHLFDLVHSDGWGEAREMFVQKVNDLQNAFNIDDTDPQKMLVDLQARKMATLILFDFLRELEGGAAQKAETEAIIDKPYIVKV